MINLQDITAERFIIDCQKGICLAYVHEFVIKLWDTPMKRLN